MKKLERLVNFTFSKMYKGVEKHFMIYRRLIFIVLLFALTACGGKNTTPPEDPVLEPEIAENTRVVDENTRGGLVGFSEDGTLRFSGSTPFLANLKAGDILVSEPAAAAPNGFLKKVIAVRQEGDEIIIATEQAALEEAILQGEATIEKQLTPDDLASSIPLLEGVRLEHRGQGELQAQADNFEYEVNFDNTVLFDNDGNKDTREDQLRVDGKLFFSDPLIGVDLGLTYKKVFGVPIYPNGVKFRMGLQFRQEARMSVFSGIKLSHSEEIPVFKQFYKPIVFFIGPVPIVLTPVMNATLKLNGEFDAQVTFKAEAVANTGLGIEFRESFKDIVNVDDIRFKDFNAADVGFSASGDNPQANVSARAELLVDGALNLYGIAGGFAGLNTYLQFDGKVPRQIGTPAWTLQGGVEARIGLNVDLILKRLKTDRKLLDLHFQIAQAVNQPPVINLSGLEGRSFQMGQPMFPFSGTGFVSDPDGDFITNVVISTDKDGIIGTSEFGFNYTFTTPGPRVFTVTAVDPEGASSSASATIDVINTPPDVNVTRPRVNETVTQGVGFVLLGAALDPNEGKLDCTKLRWTSSNSSDVLPTNNCPDAEGLVKVKFTTSGSRTITLTGTDSLGASEAVAVPITVENNGRPLATILTPLEGESFGGNFNTSTTATARLEDPDTDTLVYAWQFIFPGSPPSDPFAGPHTGIVTGARNGVTITQPNLRCSDLSAILKLTVKDETNTVTDERNIKCAPRPPR
jgi:predicted small lipoprotein YifL